MSGPLPPSIDEQRTALASLEFDAPSKYRVLFLGNFFQGPTGIVASLERALEAVGHTVFPLDTGSHVDVLDNPQGGRGGYGPVFLRPERLVTILETFRPEVIVLCAGGIVVDDRARQFLADRGIHTIGLTLSDPDVQESVIGYARNLDLHATNAHAAWVRYRDEGHLNTVHFPFGIDRGFILRDVPHDATLEADAIAIAHAPGRSERHEVMAKVEARHTVRVYGSGWPQHGSHTVSGDRLIQAARAGFVHVNFPATRAGHTNVKCGVFESIGSGAILASTRFDELATLFDYDTELLAYTDGADLARTIAELKQDSVRAESLRRRGFRRLVSEHLYEHRWLRLFEQFDAFLRNAGADRTLSRAAERSRPRVVLISGFFGARNVGDDILLSTTAAALQSDAPDTLVVAASVAPRHVERSLGLPAFNRTTLSQAERWAAAASSIILGPGGLWHDYTIAAAGGVAGMVSGATVSPAHLAQLPLMVSAYGGSFHVAGMGVGPLTDPAAQAVVRLSTRLADSVSVRDEDSLSQLRQIGAPEQIELVPDLAYAWPLDLPSPHDDPADRDTLVVNLRPWRQVEESLPAIADAVRTVADEYHLRVVGVPMQPSDHVELTNLGTILPAAVDYRVLEPGDVLSRITDVLHNARVVLGMRLHLCLLAHRLLTPAVGLTYDPKVRAHFLDIGRAAFVQELPAGPDLTSCLRRAAEEAMPHTTADLLHARSAHASAYLVSLSERLRREPVRTAPPGRAAYSSEPAGHAEPTRTMPPSSLVLDAATVEGQNLDDPGRQVRVTHRTGQWTQSFGLAERAPSKGDTATWTLRAPAPEAAGFRIELSLEQAYRENRSLAGRLIYEVLLDGVSLVAHDVTHWQPPNTVWFGGPVKADHLQIGIRLRAMRDCEDWDWGRLTKLTVVSARLMPWDYLDGLVVGSSSPFSRLGTDSILPATDRHDHPSNETPRARPFRARLWHLRRSLLRGRSR